MDRLVAVIRLPVQSLIIYVCGTTLLNDRETTNFRGCNFPCSVQWLALLSVREVPRSNLGQKTYTDLSFS